MKKFAVVVLSLMIGVSFLAAQQQGGWKLDKSHSGVIFSVRHLVVSEVTGNFKDLDVVVRATKDDFTDASVDATINVASINTDNERRDNHLKSDDFFNAEMFPQIKFKSSSFEKVGQNKYKITGDLTIRDVTKKVTFDATYYGSVKGMGGATVAGWKATLDLNRFDYNLKWNRTIESGGLVVGETVTITLNLELVKPVA
jgi:polyisoprenoid-binding protein YceI